MHAPRRPVIIIPRFERADEMLDRVRIAERLGVDQIWLDQQPDSRDSLTTAHAYLNASTTATVGVGVLPVYYRHPIAMAQAALSLAEFSGGRFVLGLGYSHHFVNEYMLGHQQGPPIAVMREYLTIVKALIDDGTVNTAGRYFTARTRYVTPRQPVPLVLAALQPRMIRLAVELCDGLALWLCSARYVRECVTPVVANACAEFGKDPAEFPVTALLPTYTGPDLEAERVAFEHTVKAYRLVPHYKRVMDQFGQVEPDEFGMFGTPEQIRQRMDEFRAAGCIPVPSPVGDHLADFEAALLAAYGPPDPGPGPGPGDR